jgi:hypothetical protein
LLAGRVSLYDVNGEGGEELAIIASGEWKLAAVRREAASCCQSVGRQAGQSGRQAMDRYYYWLTNITFYFTTFCSIVVLFDMLQSSRHCNENNERTNDQIQNKLVADDCSYRGSTCDAYFVQILSQPTLELLAAVFDGFPPTCINSCCVFFPMYVHGRDLTDLVERGGKIN